VTITHWVEDVALAIREGLDVSGSATVRLLGVRAGALLACAAARFAPDVQRIVLWDPILEGTEYLEALRRAQTALSDRHLQLSRAERRSAAPEYAGYTLSNRMVEEFRSLGAGTYSAVSAVALHVVNTSASAVFPVGDAARTVAPFACDWDAVSDELITPRPVLECLVTCLTSP
jgi:hypothetical protein